MEEVKIIKEQLKKLANPSIAEHSKKYLRSPYSFHGIRVPELRKIAKNYKNIEIYDVYNIFENPVHPYTLSLLRSLPRVDSHRYERLAIIPGTPPDCIHMPTGCPFMPRCSFVIEKCTLENPGLRNIADDHKTACWVDVKTGRPA